MIELRWARRNTGNRVLNEYGFFRDEIEQVLQYRQELDTTPLTETANYEWSEWQDVPVLDQTLPNNIDVSLRNRSTYFGNDL
jgi:hypothetical protein